MNYESDSTSFSEEADLFKETEWKGMVEDIPSGPQAISLDIKFADYQNAFGIPERINSFKVKDTVAYASNEDGILQKVREEEPFRLFTCDHFNDKYPNHSQYGAVPILHMRSDSAKQMVGVYWCNASDTFVDLIEIDGKRHAHWMSETGHL